MMLEKIHGAQWHHIFTDRYYTTLHFGSRISQTQIPFDLTNRTEFDVEVNIKKPNIIVNYIKYMSGVDRADQYALKYRLAICLFNLYILYKLKKKKRKERSFTHLRYLKMLIQELREIYRQSRDRASTLSINEPQLNEKLHVILRR
ncbi:piggyBac transposable element-derived protein 4-like [Vespula maculifrons]|uniref:PiggyBac transposable element-derived protein 4-like n=1 Tax=Vespula maculifrons TaxID=7453 RepID=A0ABD2ASL4_VESMC